MKRLNWISMLALTCSLSLIGCGSEEPDPTGDDAPSKQELAEQLASGKADSMTDWCAVFDWYDDGICDDFCALPDGDCATDDYDPCGGLSCGDDCSVCDPSDPNCFETAVIKMCQPDGTCAASVAMCGGDDTNNDDGGGDYEPCGGLSCGDTCTICDPTDPDCAETSVIKMCQADGTCAASVPTCDDYDPCEGLACGESCSLCAPGDTDCYETADLKFCQADGTCSGVEPDSCDPDGEYDPCGGLACGDLCTLCDPSDPDCFETAVIKQCNDEGVCSATAAVCE